VCLSIGIILLPWPDASAAPTGSSFDILSLLLWRTDRISNRSSRLRSLTVSQVGTTYPTITVRPEHRWCSADATKLHSANRPTQTAGVTSIEPCYTIETSDQLHTAGPLRQCLRGRLSAGSRPLSLDRIHHVEQLFGGLGRRIMHGQTGLMETTLQQPVSEEYGFHQLSQLCTPAITLVHSTDSHNMHDNSVFERRCLVQNLLVGTAQSAVHRELVLVVPLRLQERSLPLVGRVRSEPNVEYGSMIKSDTHNGRLY